MPYMYHLHEAGYRLAIAEGAPGPAIAFDLGGAGVAEVRQPYPTAVVPASIAATSGWPAGLAR
jgi:hypothetical protein